MAAIWLPEYASDNFTKDMVIQNMTARGVYDDFQLWYLIFFGTNIASPGIVPLNYTQGPGANQTNQSSSENQTSSGRRLQAEVVMTNATGNMSAQFIGGASEIPLGMENLVALILQMVDMKMK